MPVPRNPEYRITAFRIALVYFLVGCIWILISDRLLFMIAPGIHEMAAAQTAKGWVFVIASAALIWLLLDRDLMRIEAAEAERRASEQRLRLLLDNIRDHAIYLLDAQGRVVRWNPAAERIKGYSGGDFLGQPFERFFTAQDRALGRPAALLRQADGHARVQENAWLARADGSMFMAEVSISAIGEEPAGAGSQGYTMVARDITERVGMEEALRASERQFRRIVDTAQEGIWQVDEQGLTRFVNERMAEMLGRKVEQMLGHSVFEFLDEQSSQRLRESLNARQFGHRRFFDLAMLHADGRRIWVSIADSPLVDEQGLYLGRLGMISDVTERHLAEQGLRRYADRLETLHALDRAIMAAGSAAEIGRSALQRLCAQFAAPGAAILTQAGEGMAQLLASEGEAPPDGTRVSWAIRQPLDPSLGPAERLEQAIRVRLQVAGDVLGELVLLARPDAPYPAEVHEVTQEVGAVLAIAIHNARMHDQVRRHAQELETKVAERTAELRERNEELESFSYSISHDLRAPLRAMQGFAEALVEDCGPMLNDEGRQYAERIMVAGNRLDGMIRDLLAFSRLSRAELRLEPVALEHAAGLALQSLEVELRERAAEVHLEGPLPSVRAHPGTLQQVLMNLLGNAIKFVAPGIRPRVRVSAEIVGTREAPIVRCWISDNGIGIDQGHSERIFKVFERLHSVDNYPGTGIGLALVRKGVERMNGMVGLTSAPGEGSRFWFELEAAPITTTRS